MLVFVSRRPYDVLYDPMIRGSVPFAIIFFYNSQSTKREGKVSHHGAIGIADIGIACVAIRIIAIIL